MLRDLAIEGTIRGQAFKLDLPNISISTFKDCNILIVYTIIIMKYLESIFKI